MAAPAFGTSGTWSSGVATTHSFAVPSSVASGDIIVIEQFIDGSTVTISAMPTGFAHAANSPRTVAAGAGGNHTVNVVWKRATAGDTGTYDFTYSASAYVEGQAHRYTGCIASGDPWDVTAAADGGNNALTTSPAVSVTTTGPDEMLFFAATNWSGGAWTPPSGFTERTDNSSDVTADDKVQTSAGSSGTVQATCAGSDKMGSWLGALIGTTVSGGIPYTPPRYPQYRDPGETWWIQRDRRDANTVATAANPLPSPLDTAWQADGRYWHLYNDTAARDRRFVPQQRPYVSDPNLLVPAGTDPLGMPTGPAYRTAAYWDRRLVPQQRQLESDPNLLNTALLENELLGGADTAKRANVPATHAPRWWMPQQPQREAYSPGLLDTAELENELLGGADSARHYLASAYWDRREVPEQRAYISDPSFYPTIPPTDPLTLAYGVGGHYWLIYNAAALLVDRREVPQQRRYVSDPGLLATALLENELLGGSMTALHALVLSDRRQTVGYQPRWPDPTLLFGLPADPLLVGAGVGGDRWRRYHTPAYYDRREVPVWRLYISDPSVYPVPPATAPGHLTALASAAGLSIPTTASGSATTTTTSGYMNTTSAGGG